MRITGFSTNKLNPGKSFLLQPRLNNNRSCLPWLWIQPRTGSMRRNSKRTANRLRAWLFTKPLTQRIGVDWRTECGS